MTGSGNVGSYIMLRLFVPCSYLETKLASVFSRSLRKWRYCTGTLYFSPTTTVGGARLNKVGASVLQFRRSRKILKICFARDAVAKVDEINTLLRIFSVLSIRSNGSNSRW